VTDLSAAATSRVRNELVGFIFQTFNLIGDLSVGRTSSLPLTYRNMTAAERTRRWRRRSKRWA